MKKAIMLSMALSMAVLPSATAAFAAQETGTNQAAVSKFTTVARSMPLEISGKVDKISKGELTVTAKDGKVYLVPLWKLSTINGFSDLGLKVGTEVTLKSTQPDLANVKSVSSLASLTVSAKPIDIKTLKVAEGTLTPLTAVDASKLIKGADLTFTAAPSIKAVGHVDLKAIDAKEAKAVGATLSSATPVSTTAISKDSITTLTAVKGPLPDLSKVQVGTLKVVENGKVSFVAPAEGSFTLSALNEGTQLFLAGEITANGKTVKISN
ncbi:hypothetical protein EHS13_35270 [Paenibacillus psychroresistens]|uniref:DUF5666 domain-containing protein n=1 Tax=Paenibacillus psychroresistens TaxID=1778678 RepID=A0A6B8RWK4_9BACL|nr:hypothetical protein [Paenibacillus psychroresistens]QGQ99753.1 hypothetical protein EHS13_35270 [Paenibacillus psychroresistens]